MRELNKQHLLEYTKIIHQVIRRAGGGRLDADMLDAKAWRLKLMIHDDGQLGVSEDDDINGVQNSGAHKTFLKQVSVKRIRCQEHEGLW